jgi:hypothetical protein
VTLNKWIVTLNANIGAEIEVDSISNLKNASSYHID